MSRTPPGISRAMARQIYDYFHPRGGAADALTTPAIILSLRAHGEHGAIVRMITPHHAFRPLVRGARGRRMRRC